MAKQKKDLKASVEKQIADMLESTDEPSDGRLKLLALGIKMCALNAKLEESDYGDFFNPRDDGPGSTDVPAKRKRKEPAASRREAGDIDLN